MNRSLVLLVAMSVLVAHSLALRTDAAGALAPPYDQAFIAFRVARNLVFEGSWSWGPGVAGIDSYPSPLWVVIASFAERFSFSVNTVVRGLGIGCAALTLMLTGAFHPGRAASLIVPMLLAISGAMAAVAVSGTEAALLTLLLTGSFLAFERRSELNLAALTLLAGWTRDEAWILVVLLFVMRLLQRRGTAADGDRPALWPFAVPAIGFGLLCLLRISAGGEALSPNLLAIVVPDGPRLQHGLAAVLDGLVSCASPLLVLHALWYLLRGQLSATGRRALVLSGAWLLLVALRGGGGLPFAEDIVPVLPILLLAGQEGLIHALNSWKTPVRILAWGSFLVAVMASTMASIIPRDLGPLPTANLMERWLTPTASPRHGYEGLLGRRGLLEEELSTRYLREIGIFMRDELDPRSRVLTAFPGSIAYLSGLPVEDLLGRATRTAPLVAPSPAGGPRQVDTLSLLESRPQHIVPFARPRPSEGVVESFLEDLVGLDQQGTDPERRRTLEQALADYRVVTIPLQRRDRRNADLLHDRARLLRLRADRPSARLSASIDRNRRLSVQIEHHDHVQLADLVVVVVDERGVERTLSPGGRPTEDGVLRMRADLVLEETGERTIDAVVGVPLRLGRLEATELRIELVSPGEALGEPSVRLAEPLVLKLR